MDKESKKLLVKQELYQAIAHFIERQHLVAQAMLDMGLDLEEVGKYGAIAWFSTGGTRLDEFDRLFRSLSSPSEREMVDVGRRAEARNLSSTGTWKDHNGYEWDYFLHGGGCRLTNTRTGESVDWDCPNVRSFDPFSFIRHLEWQLSSPNRKDKLIHTQDWVQTNGMDSIILLIKEMIDDGLINKGMTLAD